MILFQVDPVDMAGEESNKLVDSEVNPRQTNSNVSLTTEQGLQ